LTNFIYLITNPSSSLNEGGRNTKEVWRSQQKRMVARGLTNAPYSIVSTISLNVVVRVAIVQVHVPAVVGIVRPGSSRPIVVIGRRKISAIFTETWPIRAEAWYGQK
jgi:hypothetical protein